MLPQRLGHQHMNLQIGLKTRFLNLQIGVHMFNLIGQGHDLRWPLQIFAEKGRQVLHQLPGLVAIAANHRF